FELHLQDQLHPDTRIIGYGRSQVSSEELQQRLREHIPADRADRWEELAARISYQQGSYDSAADFGRLGEALADTGLERRVFYTSTPPSTYEAIVRALSEAGLNRDPEGGWSRIVIE